MMARMVSKEVKEEEEEEPPPDRETTEKNLLHQMQLLDDKHCNSLLPEQVASAIHLVTDLNKFSEFEVRASLCFQPFCGDLEELDAAKPDFEDFLDRFPVLPGDKKASKDSGIFSRTSKER